VPFSRPDYSSTFQEQLLPEGHYDVIQTPAPKVQNVNFTQTEIPRKTETLNLSNIFQESMEKLPAPTLAEVDELNQEMADLFGCDNEHNLPK